MQTQQRRIDRPLVQFQYAIADLLNPPCDAVPVQRPKPVERLEHHQVERALQNIRSCIFHEMSSTPVGFQQECITLPVDCQQQSQKEIVNIKSSPLDILPKPI